MRVEGASVYQRQNSFVYSHTRFSKHPVFFVSAFGEQLCCRSPPPNLIPLQIGFQIGEKTMNDNAICFILIDSGYEEISYNELQKRRENDITYMNKRFVPLHGMLMEVTNADYHGFYQNIRRQRYLGEEAARNGAFSYNALDSEKISGEEIISDNSPPLDEQVLDKLLEEEMLRCLGGLDETDRRLIAALYFENIGERALAKELSITQQAVNKRRQKVITKLRELMGF